MSDAPGAAGEAPPQLTARSFTGWPAWADLPLDVVSYGPDCPTEAELRLLGRLDGQRVLELGCGGGPNSVAMAKQGAKVISVDSSAEQLGHARRLGEREEVTLELHQGDLADLAFVRADTIDAAVVRLQPSGWSPTSTGSSARSTGCCAPTPRSSSSLPHPAWRATDGGDPPDGPPALLGPHAGALVRRRRAGRRPPHHHRRPLHRPHAGQLPASTPCSSPSRRTAGPQPLVEAGHGVAAGDAVVRARKLGT